jgi:hypothetical protein
MIHALKATLSAVPRGIARVGAAAAFAFAASTAMAQSAVHEALIAIERPAAFYAQMTATAGAIGPLLEVADKDKIPPVVKQADELSRKAFNEQQVMAEIRAALAQTPDAGATGQDLPAIAARFREHEAVLDAMSLEQLQAANPKYEATLKARPDLGSIRKLAVLMAAPDLGGETAVTGKRMKWIAETIILNNPLRLRKLDEAEVERGIAQIIRQTRTEPLDERAGAFMQGVTIEGWRLRKQAVLAQLPTEDVATLLAFYSSAPGRAKRAALLQAFTTNSDKAARAVITGLMANVR